jgi:hypothetical protein
VQYTDVPLDQVVKQTFQLDIPLADLPNGSKFGVASSGIFAGADGILTGGGEKEDI